MRFIDSNVLIYSVSNEPAEAAKRRTAEVVLEATDLCLSTQVLSEFYAQATRASRPEPLFHHDAVAIVESLTRYPIQPLTVAVVRAALAARARYTISYWDAAIIEAARVIGATEVLTEDLQDGQDFEGVRIVNPFS